MSTHNIKNIPPTRKGKMLYICVYSDIFIDTLMHHYYGMICIKTLYSVLVLSWIVMTDVLQRSKLMVISVYCPGTLMITS